MILVDKSDTPIIPPACIMEKLHAELQAEKDAKAEKKRAIEEERKNNIVKNVVKNSKVISVINQTLLEYGYLEIQTGHFYNDQKWQAKNLVWYLDDTHSSYTHYYDIVPGVYNDELIFALYGLYKEAGYCVHMYEYSKGYYKNYSFTIRAKPNCDTCEI